MPYRLLGVHVNALLSGLDRVLAAWKPSLVVSLDHSDAWHAIKAATPRTVIVGRIHQPHEPDFNVPGTNPLNAARAHCEAVLPWAQRMGATYDFWQGVNEPTTQSPEAVERLADFEAERARLMSRHGFRVAVGSFAVGNPPQLAWWEQFLPALEAAREFAGALSLHEYAWPTLDRQSPWYLLRHRKVYRGEPAHNWPGLPPHLLRVPLLVTECGLDGGIEPGFPARGWRAAASSEQFLAQLAWYDAELLNDPYVVGAALYCCCAGHDSLWASFNLWPEVIQALSRDASPLYRPARVPEPVPPAPPVPPVEDRMDEVMVRLDRILELLRERGKKA